ncbi:MAG: tRNA (5-methylaminomethyl-2-thiouridine)(34)-methyltransferase MnmD [Bacteroidales bacterium]|nr:tRNA (5-methylaminomethyl-2-thiouridine)(34)-methyltransferase MnmD [Lentimicrobiaceae bacterium]MDD5695684.1 tRNA (5-methylaminomethyl-2-thiouridine)(34)-methyltransferase MnmD [Bacteroidales bacterium]
MSIQVVKTDDGSATLFVPELNEHYHSIHGAVGESLHIFIRCGLEALPLHEGTVRIFEMGFGTGLNALLTYYHTIGDTKQVDYIGIDTLPVPDDLFLQLNYIDFIDNLDVAKVFHEIHHAPWEKNVTVGSHFFLTKHRARIEEYILPGSFDLVYYDAFSPMVQPECWTLEVFSRIFQHMNPGGILVTYSSKGSVRRSLQQAGFTVEKLPGPAGKREILRGRRLIM